jgi:hypothetical protein
MRIDLLRFKFRAKVGPLVARELVEFALVAAIKAGR